MASSASSTLCNPPLTKTCHGSLSIVGKEKPLCSTVLCDPPAKEVYDYTEQPCLDRESLYPKDLRKRGGGDTDSVPSAEEESSKSGVKCQITENKTLPKCRLGRKLIEHACDDDGWFSELMEMDIRFPNRDRQDSYHEMGVIDDYPSGTTEKVTADVQPYLEKIVFFRDLLDQDDFNQAEEFLEQFLKDENTRKYRRDTLRSLSRCFRKSAVRKTPPEHSEILLRLDRKLSDELKKEEINVETIEEAFRERNWQAMNALFKAKQKSLSKKQLLQVILLAADKKKWQEFWECVDLGVDLVCPGGKLVYTHTLEDDPLSPPYRDSDDDGDTSALNKGLKEEDLDQTSPLHEALKTGEFQLEKVEDYFQKNADFSNITDKAGDPLLHLAVRHGKPELRKANVELLLQYNADVNTLDSNNKTPLQYLQHSRYKPWEVELLMTLVTKSKLIHPKTWRAGAHEWTPLHMLCNSGHYQDLHKLVEKGDNPEALRRGLTLIDTVVLQESLHWEVKRMLLDTLLKDPIKLGPFHAQVIQRRAKEDERDRKYLSLLLCGKDYLCPSDRLLFPLISTCTVRTAYKEILVMLLEGDAVCESELAYLLLSLDSLDDDPAFVRRVKGLLEKKGGSPADKVAQSEQA